MAESGKPVAGEKIHAKDVTDELAKKADILNRDQSIAAKEIIIGKPYVSPGPSAFKNARLLKIDSEGNIWNGAAEEDFANATPDEEIVSRAVWTQATMGDIWLGKAYKADGKPRRNPAQNRHKAERTAKKAQHRIQRPCYALSRKGGRYKRGSGGAG